MKQLFRDYEVSVRGSCPFSMIVERPFADDKCNSTVRLSIEWVPRLQRLISEFTSLEISRKPRSQPHSTKMKSDLFKIRTFLGSPPISPTHVFNYVLIVMFHV